MRYEKELHSIEKDSKKTIEMVEDIESLIVDLKKEFSSDEEMELYTRLAELMERISDYILNSEKNFGLSTLFQTNFFRLFFRYCTGV